MAETDAITAAIESSMADAGLTDTGGDDGGTLDTLADTGDEGLATEGAAEGSEGASGDEGESVAAVGTEASPSAAAVPAAAVETAAQKAEREQLEALGLTAPKPGQKENRLPHSRVSKMVLKAVETGKTNATKELQPRLQAAEAAAAEHARLSVMADRDPMRYVEALAVANPEKWKPILARLSGAPVAASGTSRTAAPAEGSAFNTPMPKPNVKNPDGSTTYDEAGLASLMEWSAARGAAIAEERVTKKFEAEFGPVVEDHKRAAFNAAQMPRIQQQIKTARERWGDLFEADYKKAEAGGESEILAYQKTNRCSFEDACTAILLPRVRADRNTMRESILAELNTRPAAAAPTHVAARPVVKSNDPVSDAIRNSMAAAGLQ